MASGRGAGRRLLLHHLSRGNLVVGTMVLIDLEREPEVAKLCVASFTVEPLSFGTSTSRALQRQTHRHAKRQQERGAERTEKYEEFPEAPDPSADRINPSSYHHERSTSAPCEPSRGSEPAMSAAAKNASSP